MKTYTAFSFFVVIDLTGVEKKNIHDSSKHTVTLDETLVNT